MAAGLALSELAGAPALLALGLAGIGAGAAVAADLDHANATATRSVGRVTGVASWAIRKLSARIYARTKTPRDRSNKDGHRGITHTIPGALALGPVMAAPVMVATRINKTAGLFSTLGLLWLLIVWSLRALPPHHSKTRDYATAAVLTAAAWLVLHGEFGDWTPVLLAATISVGTLVHIFGDGLTDYGVPLAFPFVVKGERWRSLGMPELLRFKAGKGVENWFVFPLSIAVVGALLLRLYPPLWDAAVALLARAVGLG